MLLPGRGLGKKQRRKKSALSDRLLMVPGREPGEKQKRNKSVVSDWL